MLFRTPVGLRWPEHEDRRAEGRQHDDEEQEGERAHRPALGRPSARSWPSSPQASPPAQRSFFQIGTDAFTASMPKRAASNASAGAGVETATTTAVSPMASARRGAGGPPGPISGHRPHLGGHGASRGSTCSS